MQLCFCCFSVYVQNEKTKQKQLVFKLAGCVFLLLTLVTIMMCRKPSCEGMFLTLVYNLMPPLQKREHNEAEKQCHRSIGKLRMIKSLITQLHTDLLGLALLGFLH